MSQLETTQWLHYLSGLLESAVHIAHTLCVEARPVLVHCSDGWDRTTQATALTEILLDPFYRTFEVRYLFHRYVGLVWCIITVSLNLIYATALIIVLTIGILVVIVHVWQYVLRRSMMRIRSKASGRCTLCTGNDNGMHWSGFGWAPNLMTPLSLRYFAYGPYFICAYAHHACIVQGQPPVLL